MHISHLVKYLILCNVSVFSICAILVYLSLTPQTFEPQEALCFILCPLSLEERWSLCEYRPSSLRSIPGSLWYATCTTLFLPEKSAGRVAFSSVVCEDIMGGAVGAGGTGPTVGAEDTGSGEVSGAGDKDGMGQGFLSRQG